MNEKRTNKDEVIAYALEKAGVENPDDCIMVGDRKFDVDGAKKLGMKSVGVTYGYGSREEIEKSDPTFIADSVDQLKQILM